MTKGAFPIEGQSVLIRVDPWHAVAPVTHITRYPYSVPTPSAPCSKPCRMERARRQTRRWTPAKLLWLRFSVTSYASVSPARSTARVAVSRSGVYRPGDIESRGMASSTSARLSYSRVTIGPAGGGRNRSARRDSPGRSSQLSTTPAFGQSPPPSDRSANRARPERRLAG